MDSSISPKDEIWFLRVCHHISTGLYQSFGGKSSLHNQGRWSLSALKIEAASFPKRLVPISNITRCHIPEDRDLELTAISPSHISWIQFILSDPVLFVEDQNVSITWSPKWFPSFSNQEMVMTAVCFSTEDKPSSSYGEPPCDRVTHIPLRSVTIYSLVRNRRQIRPGYSRRHGTKYLAWNPFSLTRDATLPYLAYSYSYFPILYRTSHDNSVHRKFCSDNRVITAGSNEGFGLLEKSEGAGGE